MNMSADADSMKWKGGEQDSCHAEADRNRTSPTESVLWKSGQREHLGAGWSKEE